MFNICLYTTAPNNRTHQTASRFIAFVLNKLWAVRLFGWVSSTLTCVSCLSRLTWLACGAASGLRGGVHGPEHVFRYDDISTSMILLRGLWIQTLKIFSVVFHFKLLTLTNDHRCITRRRAMTNHEEYNPKNFTGSAWYYCRSIFLYI
jgi:hypothetical protein